jgi:carboxyvinyl-carboxyphosphonate phosphorylmutase
VEDAVARTKAYTASGADALFYTGIRTLPSSTAVAAVATLPIILGGIEGTELKDRDYLAARGVRIALQGHQPIMAAQQAVYATLKRSATACSRRPARPAERRAHAPHTRDATTALDERFLEETRDVEYGGKPLPDPP